MTSIDHELKKILTSTTTLRVQPVKPENDQPSELAWQLVGSIGVLLLGGWFLCLGTLSAHSYWPGIPALAYWPAVAMLLGLQTVAFTLRGSAWKWHRR